jgi:glycyl-tRNA synthetase beta chain
MRSGTSTFRWVRPLKRILFLFDGEVIPFELEGLVAGNLTEGHRFLGSGQPLSVSDFASYHKVLADNSVILDHAERQKIILEQARAVCAEAGCELIEDQGLLEEVAGLNEYPVPLLGDMDPAFLTLPPEVIKTSMRTHQKYFAVRDKAGKMVAKFVITANMKAVDGGAEIKRGNAKVLSARLSDAVFFWKEDNREGNFDQWLTKLEGVTFHAKLGTMAQRVSRIVELAKHIAPLVGADAELAGEAARLAKADLASYMVGEFPELQGVMGGYYADAAGMRPEIANAIRDHYKPQGPSDSVPIGKIGATVALADKVDALVGFFAVGEKPTGSKDPQALRRSALGVLRILREFSLRFALGKLVKFSFNDLLKHSDQVKEKFWGLIPRERDAQTGDLEAIIGFLDPASSDHENTEIVDLRYPLIAEYHSNLMSDVVVFFNDRLKVMLKEEGFRFDVIEAVLTLNDDDLVRQTQKIAALETILKTPEGDDLLAAHKRAANILAAEAKKGDLPSGEPQVLPGAPAVEMVLLTQLNTAKREVGTALEAEKYIDALHHIAALRQGVDAFLDGVLVNADDTAIRANRLLILKAVCELSGEIADLSKIV